VIIEAGANLTPGRLPFPLVKLPIARDGKLKAELAQGVARRGGYFQFGGVRTMCVSNTVYERYLTALARMGLILLLTGYAAAKSRAQQPAVTVQAELVEPMDAGHAKVGQSIKARVKVDWSDGTCTLKRNSMVKGHVVGLQSSSKTAKDSGIALLFDSGECGGHDMKPFPLTIVSVIGSAPAPPSLADSPGMGIGEGSRGGAVAAANAPAIEGDNP
jgi:hypothetical protein